MTGRRRLRIARLGGFARVALDSAEEARLLGVFERSLHVAIGDAIVCVVENGLGNGPLNAVLAPIESWPQRGGWTRLAGSTGERTDVSGRVLTVGELALDFAGAEPWQPAPWPTMPTQQIVSLRLDQLARIADRDAPVDGLSQLVLCTPDPAAGSSPIARVAMPRLIALTAWLRDQFAGGPEARTEACSRSAPVPTTLLGLGPGLTPSGDDVLCGALIALNALGRRHTATALGEAVVRDAAAATTALSRSFLKAAAEGQGAEALHILIAAMLSNQADSIEPLVRDVARIGHTSGWDALAGAALVLRAFADISTA